MSTRRNWTREELIVVFNLYCKIPFKKTVKIYPPVIETVKLIGRTPSAVAFKLGNFGFFDPELKKRGIKGLKNASKLDKKIWEEFNNNWEDLVFESEQIIEQLKEKTVQEVISESIFPEGKDVIRKVKTRVNQSFFRQTILTSYEQACCITGLNMSDLLIASHIVPWSKNKECRTNPQNGLCLNALHDKAFDKGWITIDEKYNIKTSPHLLDFEENEAVVNFLLNYDKKPIRLPEKFVPDPKFLDYHYHQIFKT